MSVQSFFIALCLSKHSNFAINMLDFISVITLVCSSIFYLIFFQKTKNTAPFSIIQLQGKSEYITLTIDIHFDSRNKRKKHYLKIKL